MGVTADGRLFFATGNRQSDVLVFPWSGDPARIGEPLHTFPVSDYIPYHLSGAGVRFSPDGRRVLSPGLANDLIVRDLASGASRSIASPLKAISRLDWASSGDAVLILGTDPASRFGLHRYDLAGNSLTQLAALPEATTRDFLLSPDGQTLYHGDHTAIYARRLPAGEDRKLWGEASVAGQMQLHLTRDGKTLIVRLSGFLGALDLATNRMRELYRTGESNRNTLWASALTPDGSAVMTIRRLPGMKMEFATFPLDGGQPKVTAAPSTWRGLALSPDGKWLATTRLTRRDQIWSLANFLPR